MIWLTNLSPDFDVERRRRWYAASIGAAGSSTLIAMILIRLRMDGLITGSDDPVWEIALVFLGMGFFFFVLKYVAAYALWYRPYASRVRAIVLSLSAMLAVYLGLFAGVMLFSAFRGSQINFGEVFKRLWEFHLMIYGLPYLSAAFVGWCFARSLPDVREQF